MSAVLKILALPLFVILMASSAMAMTPDASNLETHSAYRVTTYSFGNITDFDSAIAVSPQEYKPLMITGAAADVLTGQQGLNAPSPIGSNPEAVEGFAIAARFEAGKSLAVKSVFGMAHNMGTENLKSENRPSWEANLGVIYSLLPNLDIELHLGYMDTGDLFKNRSEYSNVDSIIMISNKLTLSF